MASDGMAGIGCLWGEGADTWGGVRIQWETFEEQWGVF